MDEEEKTLLEGQELNEERTALLQVLKEEIQDSIGGDLL